ncbi:MAG TPA: response regulator [Asticcacaulis sp.]|nr:response regulator [Asticcacaulis sp.]
MNAPHVLIVEDEADIRKYLRATLGAHDFVPLEAATAKEALQIITTQRPDVILLDLGLPDRDGADLIAEVRGWSETPIIVLSAREQERDKIEALERGADDYLTKPFAAGELIARLKVALRHAQRLQADGGTVYEHDGLTVDLAARRVRLDGEDVRLTPIEYKLLSLLVKNAGKVVTHAQLLREVWGKHSLDNNHYLRIHTQHLREKLKDDALNPRFILTEPGVGYRFRD